MTQRGSSVRRGTLHLSSLLIVVLLASMSSSSLKTQTKQVSSKTALCSLLTALPCPVLSQAGCVGGGDSLDITHQWENPSCHPACATGNGQRCWETLRNRGNLALTASPEARNKRGRGSVAAGLKCCRAAGMPHGDISFQRRFFTWNLLNGGCQLWETHCFDCW